MPGAQTASLHERVGREKACACSKLYLMTNTCSCYRTHADKAVCAPGDAAI